MNERHMVTFCVCHDVTFEHLLQVAKATGARTVEELKEHIDFGFGCHMCNPYVKAMLKTGQTRFDPYHTHIEEDEDDE